MLSYSDIKRGIYIILDGEPYYVLESQIVKKQRQKPFNQTKLKNLVSGNVIDQTFRQSDKVEEAELEKQDVVFEYQKNDKCWFSHKGDPSKRFMLKQAEIEDVLPWLSPPQRGKREETQCVAVLFDEKIIGINIPIKMSFKVVEAPPNVRGNTAQGGSKKVVLETGAIVDVPMFIEAGDTIEVNTQTGKYSGRI